MNFSFEEEYILQNEMVLIRPLVTDDIEHFLPFALSESSLWTYSLQSAAGEEDGKEENE